jgi:hypothetical protein
MEGVIAALYRHRHMNVSELVGDRPRQRVGEIDQQLIEGFVPEAAWLSDAETLTYLHSCISTRRHRVEGGPKGR